jgi:hypothetical protein
MDQAPLTGLEVAATAAHETYLTLTAAGFTEAQAMTIIVGLLKDI